MSNITKTSKIVLITGSTSGIGRATVQELVKHASILILPVRNMIKGEELKKELEAINPSCQIDLFQCDLEFIESIKSSANLILGKYRIIDTIINNAGIMEPDYRLTDDNIEAHFQVNVLSQYIFNTILTPLVVASSAGRIINLSSMAHQNAKFELDSIQAQTNKVLIGVGLYSNSNLYRNLLTFRLAKELADTNVTVNCLHPGIIRTNLGSQTQNKLWKVLLHIFYIFTKPASEGAKTSIHLALSQEAGQITGKYWSNCKVVQSSELSLNMELANQLAKKCKELTGV